MEFNSGACCVISGTWGLLCGYGYFLWLNILDMQSEMPSLGFMETSIYSETVVLDKMGFTSH